MGDIEDVPVLIVGGGPVGLTLAGELGRRGLPCLLVEGRTRTTEHPKATLLGARSMEVYRAWGIDAAIYDAALPPEHEYNIVFTTRLSRYELHRFRNPSIRDVRTRDPRAVAAFRELEWSPYLKTQIGQQALEPVLRDFVATQPDVVARYGWKLTTFEPDGSGVVAQLEEVATGQRRTVRARHLVGCDGGMSTVRRQLGVRYTGRGAMRRNVSFYFRSPDFVETHGKGIANLYFVFAPDSFGVFTAINGDDLWNFQYYFLDPARETENLDPAAVLEKAVGRPFEFELLATQHWRHHQSVAKRWRVGPVFLAGDAAHLFVPTGGVGMNTGIADAWDLAWKLDATHQGWAGKWLLDSYEAERKPIAIRNSIVSANNSDKIDMIMDETPDDIDSEATMSRARRAELTVKLRWLSRQFSSAGVHLGYRYTHSPICVPDGMPEPPDDPSQVVPSTWPGYRAPHAWLADGRSTLDLWGPGFVLAHAHRSTPPANLTAAARAVGMPLETVEIVDPGVAEVLERDFVLVRPDGHVAWRGEAPPDDVASVIDRARGACPPAWLLNDAGPESGLHEEGGAR